jgi:hypothetical protein
MDDLFDVPPDLITESADLSGHHDETTIQTSDDEDNEQACPTSNCGGTLLGDTSLPETVWSRVQSPSFTAPFALDSEAEESLDTNALAVREDRGDAARLSVKRDLTATEISSVAELLLRDNTLTFVLSNSHSISAAWASSVQAVGSRGVVDSMVAAF